MCHLKKLKSFLNIILGQNLQTQDAFSRFPLTTEMNPEALILFREKEGFKITAQMCLKALLRWLQSSKTFSSVDQTQLCFVSLSRQIQVLTSWLTLH